jgi:hypothetical protein
MGFGAASTVCGDGASSFRGARYLRLPSATVDGAGPQVSGFGG